MLIAPGTVSSFKRRAMKSKIIVAFVIGVAACALGGCASIVSGRHADVAIDSYPSNAHVVIHDDYGREVASLNTPGVVSLKRNRRYFLPARYTAVVMAEGYQATEVPIRSTVNPWILGNIVIGGIPGLIVDNATGAAWQPRRSEIHTQLAPLGCLGPDSMYSANPPMPSGESQIPEYVAARSEQVAPSQGNEQKAAPSATLRR
jgi:hypothetical protein